MRKDLTLKQGETFQKQIIWRQTTGVPVNITSFTARMQVRQTPTDPGILLELTDVNGRITLGGVAGTIDLEVSATVTAGLANWGSAFYDLELVSPNGIVTRLLEGRMIFSAEVTK